MRMHAHLLFLVHIIYILEIFWRINFLSLIFLIFKKIIYIIQILENIKIYTVRNCSLLSVSITSNQFPFLQTTNIIRFCVSFQRYFM